MYCVSCGKKLADDAAFCSNCGTPVPQNDALAGLVAAARNGGQDAIGALYEKTYSKVYYTVKSMIKDEETVLDVVQDAYIKAFAHLDSFQGDTKFLPWVRQIAANTARDWLKKKRPMLFADLNSDDEQDTPIEELLPDECSGNLPEQVIDREETKRLIREIIEELPEDQRAAIGMFYYEEMSVKEIAAAMATSESAVKSRLMYGRGKIEKKVLELEKQGTKLYSLSPIPFLLLLFRNQEAYAAEVPDSRILHAILASRTVDAAVAAGAGAAGGGTAGAGAAGGGTAGTGAAAGETAGTGAAGEGTSGAGAAVGGGTAGTGTTAAGEGTAGAGTAAGMAVSGAVAGGLGALKVGLIVLGAVAAVGLGAFGVSRIFSDSAESEESSDIEDVVDREEPGTPFTFENIIGREESEEPPASEDVIHQEGPAPIDEALEQYRIIIGQADSYEYGSIPDLETYGYRYALVLMQPDDPVPTLLMEKEERGWTIVTSVRIFQYDPDTKTVRQPAETLGGGIRGGLSMAGDGEGILSTDWSSGTGMGSVIRFTLDGDSIKRETYWEGQIFEMPESIKFIEIEWREISDLSVLDGWTAPEADSAVSSETGDSDTLLVDGDRIVLTGIVATLDYDEISGLLGPLDPNEFDEYTVEFFRSMTYRVILLDTPQTLHLKSGDPESDYYYSHEVLMIDLQYADEMEQYEGRHIMFSIDPAHTYWPTESAPPVGQPSTTDIHILEYLK